MSIFLFGSIASWALTGVSILVDYHRQREGMKRVRGARIRAKCSWNILVLTIDTAMGCISWRDGMSGCLAPLHSSGKFCRNIHGLNVSCVTRTQPRGKDVPCRAPTTKWKTNGNIDPWNLKHGQETDHRTIDLRGWRERGENEVEVRKTCETWRTRTGHRRPPSWKTRVRPIRMNVIVWMVQTT